MNNEHSNRADELIARAAKDYNEPGPVPREEIWNRIAEARRSQRSAQLMASRSGRNRYWIWPALGVAAAGLVGIGVAIGRNVERTRIQTPVATATPDSAATRPDQVAAVLPADGGHIPAKNRASTDPRSTAPRSRSLGGGDRDSSGGVAYRVAVANHVVGSEAMITAFRASARRGDVDAQLAKWSRDLLGETRLLQSAAPSDDVTMKRLLEDLELVLAQIVQYTNRGTHSPEDLDLIERSIRHRAVMSNIRNLSAGQRPSGT
jgi:hypothetical protein